MNLYLLGVYILSLPTIFDLRCSDGVIFDLRCSDGVIFDLRC
jgi:hypothetical protein